MLTRFIMKFHFTKSIALKKATIRKENFSVRSSLITRLAFYIRLTQTLRATMFAPFNAKNLNTTISTQMLTGSIIPLHNTASTTNISWKSELLGVGAWTVNGHSGTTSIRSLQKMLVEAGLGFSAIHWIGANSEFHESSMSSCKLYFDCDDLNSQWVICTCH